MQYPNWPPLPAACSHPDLRAPVISPPRGSAARGPWSTSGSADPILRGSRVCSRASVAADDAVGLGTADADQAAQLHVGPPVPAPPAWGSWAPGSTGGEAPARLTLPLVL